MLPACGSLLRRTRRSTSACSSGPRCPGGRCATAATSAASTTSPRGWPPSACTTTSRSRSPRRRIPHAGPLGGRRPAPHPHRLAGRERPRVARPPRPGIRHRQGHALPHPALQAHPRRRRARRRLRGRRGDAPRRRDPIRHRPFPRPARPHRARAGQRCGLLLRPRPAPPRRGVGPGRNHRAGRQGAGRGCPHHPALFLPHRPGLQGLRRRSGAAGITHGPLRPARGAAARVVETALV